MKCKESQHMFSKFPLFKNLISWAKQSRFHFYVRYKCTWDVALRLHPLYILTDEPSIKCVPNVFGNGHSILLYFFATNY